MAKVTPAKNVQAQKTVNKLGKIQVKTVTGKSVPGKSVPAKVVPAKVVPAKVVTGKVVPVKAVPAKSVPAKAVTGKVVTNKTTGNTAVKKATVAIDNTEAEENWDKGYEEDNTQGNEEDQGDGTVDCVKEEPEGYEEEYGQDEGNEDSVQEEAEGFEGECTEDNEEQMETQEEQEVQKEQVSDPTVLMKMSVARTSSMLSSGDIKKFLNIKQVKVMKVTQTDWIPIAEVRVCDADDKDKLLTLSGGTVGGFEVKFEVAEKSDTLLPPVQPVELSSTVMAEDIPKAATVQDIKKLFSTVKKVRIPIPKTGGKRFALLEFATPEEAKDVITDKQGLKLHGKALVLKIHLATTAVPSVAVPALTTEDITITDENKKVLFIGNLLYETTDETVKAYFDTCKFVRLLKSGPKGKSKGMGFVHFHTAADALKALIEKKETWLEGRQILLQFADGERRTAEDYRNKPMKNASSIKKPRDRPKPYTQQDSKKTSYGSNRWVSRAEVQVRQTSLNKTLQGVRGAAELRGRRRADPGLLGTGMGRAFGSRSAAGGSRFSDAYGAVNTSYGVRQGEVDRGFASRQGAVGGSYGDMYEGGGYGYEDQSSYMAGGMRDSSSDFEASMKTGLLATPNRRQMPGYSQGGFDTGLEGQRFNSGLKANRFDTGMEASRGEELYRGPSPKVQALQNELERTRRLEMRLKMALEEKARLSSFGGQREEERAGWKDTHGQYGGEYGADEGRSSWTDNGRQGQYDRDYGIGEARSGWRDEGSSLSYGQHDRYDQGW